LSHRYGARSLPERIIAKEFDILVSEAKSGGIDLAFDYDNEDDDLDLNIENLLDYCYMLNDNETPPRRVLIPLEDVFKTYDPKAIIFNLLKTIIIL
jgi:hypothetical protein